jgi:hypothetical protein
MNIQNLTSSMMSYVGFGMLLLFVVEMFTRTALMTWKAIRDMWREVVR